MFDTFHQLAYTWGQPMFQYCSLCLIFVFYFICRFKLGTCWACWNIPIVTWRMPPRPRVSRTSSTGSNKTCSSYNKTFYSIRTLTVFPDSKFVLWKYFKVCLLTSFDLVLNLIFKQREVSTCWSVFNFRWETFGCEISYFYCYIVCTLPQL